ncbi:MAG: hypothetical protein ACK5NN_09415, partial [Sphingomonadaceae bacterium]
EPGIYVRSRGSLDDMWKHFRKFTRVQDESGKWAYLNFWHGYVPLALGTDSSLALIGESFFAPLSSAVVQPDDEDREYFTIIYRPEKIG